MFRVQWFLCAATLFCHVGCGYGYMLLNARHDSAAPVSVASFSPDSSGDFSTEVSNSEEYEVLAEADFLAVAASPVSTFGVDVDTASYSNIRRILNQGRRPPPGAVRIEEMVNYFPYAYTPPQGPEPFAVDAEVAACPWKPQHRLVRIGLQGRTVPETERPQCQLVFLVDVSGSMSSENKLPLVKRSLKALLGRLEPQDRVALVTYAGESGVLLPSTLVLEKKTIEAAIDELGAAGATNGAGGIQAAYKEAREHFMKEGVNRVILCTDGDFNVGASDTSSLVALIQKEAKSGVYLSVLGFGRGNLKDSRMEQIADHGNGNYAYIDTISEARKVLVEQTLGTLVTIAKDVKIQVEFNPARVQAYRLIGYENRALRQEDFRDDQKDAGEIGAGHSVTALYEVVPTGVDFQRADLVDSKYQSPATPLPRAIESNELMEVRVRYLPPEGGAGVESSFPVPDAKDEFASASPDYQFAAAVAAFGMLLRESKHKGNATWQSVTQWAQPGLANDPHGYRREFSTLIELAEVAEPAGE